MPEIDPANFALSPVPGRRPVTAEQLEVWARVYGRKARQIRRWISEGVAKGDPCPLDHPRQMPGWWARVMTWSCPAWLIEIANAAPLEKGAAGEEGQSGAGGREHRESSLGDISGFGLEDGEAVRQAKSIVQAAWKKLTAAHDGQGGDIDLLSRRHAAALLSLGRVEAREDLAAKRRGDLVPLASVRRDVETAVEMLRQTRKSMPRRVLELLPGLDPDVSARISRAILEARKQEDAVFRRLPSLKGLEDVRQLLGE